MAKDRGGHGSESRGGSSFDNINAQRKAQGFKPMPEKNRGMHDFFDYMAGSGPKPDFMNAASAVVGSGPKSAPVETHPAHEEYAKGLEASYRAQHGWSGDVGKHNGG